MSAILESDEDILRFCEHARRLPPEQRGEALQRLMAVDWSHFSKEASDYADDTEFFLLFGMERGSVAGSIAFAESKARSSTS